MLMRLDTADDKRPSDVSATLLGVDVGVRTGLALYGQDGKLRWYRSHNFGTTVRLRRGVASILRTIPHLVWLVIEGGGNLADVWQREAHRHHLLIRQISAETWRRWLLYPRQQRRGVEAKEAAIAVARRVITWSGIRRPTSLRDDTAEAILVGLWGVVTVGWLPRVPDVV